MGTMPKGVLSTYAPSLLGLSLLGNHRWISQTEPEVIQMFADLAQRRFSIPNDKFYQQFNLDATEMTVDALSPHPRSFVVVLALPARFFLWFLGGGVISPAFRRLSLANLFFGSDVMVPLSLMSW